MQNLGSPKLNLHARRVNYWQQAPWVAPQEAAALAQSLTLSPQQPPTQPQAAVSQHTLEVGDPGDGSLTARCLPALPPAQLTPGSGLGLSAESASSRGGEAGGVLPEEGKDVLSISAEGLLLRAAAANATVQLGMPACKAPSRLPSNGNMGDDITHVNQRPCLCYVCEAAQCAGRAAGSAAACSSGIKTRCWDCSPRLQADAPLKSIVVA